MISQLKFFGHELNSMKSKILHVFHSPPSPTLKTLSSVLPVWVDSCWGWPRKVAERWLYWNLVFKNIQNWKVWEGEKANQVAHTWRETWAVLSYEKTQYLFGKYRKYLRQEEKEDGKYLTFILRTGHGIWDKLVRNQDPDMPYERMKKFW